MCKEEKAALRRKWKTLRQNVPNREEKSRMIAGNLLRHPGVMEAGTVFVYLSFGAEVETKNLIEAFLALGKRVAVPFCDTQTHTMTAEEVSDITRLKPGTYGILEPDSTGKAIPKEEIDLVLVPGLAFDREGFRLGYGGGYYDRYLEDFTGTSIGLCFAECLTHRLPRGEYDKPVDMVMTEKGR